MTNKSVLTSVYIPYLTSVIIMLSIFLSLVYFWLNISKIDYACNFYSQVKNSTELPASISLFNDKKDMIYHSRLSNSCLENDPSMKCNLFAQDVNESSESSISSMNFDGIPRTISKTLDYNNSIVVVSDEYRIFIPKNNTASTIRDYKNLLSDDSFINTESTSIIEITDSLSITSSPSKEYTEQFIQLPFNTSHLGTTIVINISYQCDESSAPEILLSDSLLSPTSILLTKKLSCSQSSESLVFLYNNDNMNGELPTSLTLRNHSRTGQVNINLLDIKSYGKTHDFLTVKYNSL